MRHETPSQPQLSRGGEELGSAQLSTAQLSSCYVCMQPQGKLSLPAKPEVTLLSASHMHNTMHQQGGKGEQF